MQKKLFSHLKLNSGATLEFLALKMLSKHSYSIEETFDRLKEAGFKTPMGSLYPLFAKFRARKYVISSYEEGDTKAVIKTYSITEEGKKRLADLQRDWKYLNRLIATI